MEHAQSRSMVRNGVSVSYKVEILYYVGGSCNFMYYFLDLLFIVSVMFSNIGET